MKHVLNVCGLLLFLLGLAAASDTPWGWAIMAIPLVYWSLRLLTLIHKNRFCAILFWIGMAYLQWQLALAALLLFAFTSLVRATDWSRYPRRNRVKKKKAFNPATGLPMLGFKGVDVDTDGNPYGVGSLSSDD